MRGFILDICSDKSPVHAEHLPGDERGVVAEQKRHGARDVLRRAEPAKRRLLGELRLRFKAVLVHHARVDHAGGDAVDAHAAGAELLRQRAREADERGLARGVRDLARRADAAPPARDGHDAAAAARDHARRERAAEGERARDVHVHDAVPLRGRHVA